MHPYLFRIGDLSIPAYPILYGSGIAAGGVIMLVLGRQEGLPIRRIAHLILLLTLTIIIGGRAFYVVQFGHLFSGQPDRALNLGEGGQVFYGGALLTVAVLPILARVLRLPVGTTYGLVAVGAPLGLAIGRLGCYCRGCCYGAVSNLPWAIRFPKHVDLAGNAVGPPVLLSQIDRGLATDAADCSLAVHPAQLYSSALSLGVFFLMLWLWRTHRLRGRLAIVYLVVYAVCRFMLECVRDNPVAFAGLTNAQVISVVIVPVGLIVLWSMGRTRIKPVTGGPKTIIRR